MSEICEQVTSVSAHGTFCAEEDNLPRWFAVYTTPRHEKHVSEILADRRIETFLPLYRSTRQWKKSRPVVLELPLFPTYVFVRIERQARGSILGTPGVLSIVGSSREPWPLPDLEIEALRSGLLERKIEPHPYLTVGERVRIKAGVMTGVEGVLVRKKNDLRVVLSLETIMQSVAVEVDADDVEPVTRTSTSSAREAWDSALPSPLSTMSQTETVCTRNIWVPSN
jgi:transcription antitermination factor NusG